MPKESLKTPSQKIDELIAELDDWRRGTFSEVRKVFKDAAPGIVEEWKWMGTPTWYHGGLIAVANPHKGKVKVTFDQGAHLPDPNKLFNAGLEGNQRRAIDLFEGDKVNKRALKALVVAAIAFNRDRAKKKAAKKAHLGPRPPNQ
jgi:hypothetical protein